MNDRYSKLAFLHRVKERKTPSLSAQASFALFSLKVAWSGKSLIDQVSTTRSIRLRCAPTCWFLAWLLGSDSDS